MAKIWPFRISEITSCEYVGPTKGWAKSREMKIAKKKTRCAIF